MDATGEKSKTTPRVILAGDIGGTKTRLAIGPVEHGRFTARAEEVFESAKFKGLEEIVERFFKTHNVSAAHAGFGVAGPVKHGRCETTNLPWVIEAARLGSLLHLESTALINDLEAAAHGLAVLDPDGSVALHAGSRDAAGNMALIAPGTGLGEAGLYWDGIQHRPFASEGGHADFASRNALEIELLRYLLERYDHVSYERILSGPGLYEIYRFLRDSGRGEEPVWLSEALRAGDPPAVISRLALGDRSSLCTQALAQFVSLLGAEAGNIALKFLATGGVFLAGGIAPKILPALKGESFLDAFLGKGRMRPILAAMPIRVVLDERLSLKGAARCALMHAQASVRPVAEDRWV